jgi:enolase
VPSGASTGSREAVERRDGDAPRYGGLGVLGAVAAVGGEIASCLTGREWRDLAEIDAALMALDGTPGKSRLGANAIVGVSMACARALALADGRQLWDWLTPAGVVPRLPVPHFNVINGGVHAPNPLDFQEFMIAPLGAPSFPDAVRAGAEVYAALRGVLAARGYATGLGDEGGFAPQIAEPEEALELLVTAIGDAGYAPGRDGVAIALDPASSEFRGEDGLYRVAGQALSSTEMIERYAQITDRFPVWLIEDGLAENDWDGWSALTERLGERVRLVGDDIFVTSPAIIAEAISRGIGSRPHQGQPDRHRHRNPGGDRDVPRGRLRRARLPPLRRDHRHLHRRPRRRRRMRHAENGRASPRRACRQVQPAAGDRRGPASHALRPGPVATCPVSRPAVRARPRQLLRLRPGPGGR